MAWRVGVLVTFCPRKGINGSQVCLMFHFNNSRNFRRNEGLLAVQEIEGVTKRVLLI